MVISGLFNEFQERLNFEGLKSCLEVFVDVFERFSFLWRRCVKFGSRGYLYG